MATFVGYNSINQYKRFVLTDFELIKRDLLNYFNIRQGEKVGRPDVGTKVWDFIFEPQSPETTELIRDEILRIVSKDPRAIATDVTVYAQNNGILIELQVQTVGSSATELLSLFFNEASRTADYV
jgi:phage baseplate assembly protein W